VLVKQFSRAQPGWDPEFRLRCVRCIRCGVSSHPVYIAVVIVFTKAVRVIARPHLFMNATRDIVTMCGWRSISWYSLTAIMVMWYITLCKLYEHILFPLNPPPICLFIHNVTSWGSDKESVLTSNGVMLKAKSSDNFLSKNFRNVDVLGGLRTKISLNTCKDGPTFAIFIPPVQFMIRLFCPSSIGLSVCRLWARWCCVKIVKLIVKILLPPYSHLFMVLFELKNTTKTQTLT